MVENVASFLQLVPGVRATPARLAVILQHIRKEGEVFMGRHSEAMPGYTVHIMFNKAEVGSPDVLALEVTSPNDDESFLLETNYPFTPDGLMSALVDAKTAIAEEKQRVPCPGCPDAERTARGMPKCVKCMLTEAVAI